MGKDKHISRGGAPSLEKSSKVKQSKRMGRSLAAAAAAAAAHNAPVQSTTFSRAVAAGRGSAGPAGRGSRGSLVKGRQGNRSGGNSKPRVKSKKKLVSAAVGAAAAASRRQALGLTREKDPNAILKGPFSSVEVEQVHTSLQHYADDCGITLDELKARLKFRASMKRNETIGTPHELPPNCMKVIAGGVPTREQRQVLDFIKHRVLVDQGGARKRGRWTPAEVKKLCELHRANGGKNWAKIAESLGRTVQQCRDKFRLLVVDKGSVLAPRGPWTAAENAKLTSTVRKLYEGDSPVPLNNISWVKVAAKIPNRNQVECRRHWVDTLYPRHVATAATPTLTQKGQKYSAQTNYEVVRSVAEQIQGNDLADVKRITWRGCGGIMSAQAARRHFFVIRSWWEKSDVGENPDDISFPELVRKMMDWTRSNAEGDKLDLSQYAVPRQKQQRPQKSSSKKCAPGPKKSAKQEAMKAAQAAAQTDASKNKKRYRGTSSVGRSADSRKRARYNASSM